MEKDSMSFAITLVLAIGLVLTVGILAYNYSTKASTALPETRTISVSGTSIMTTMPDKAEIYLAIVTEGITAKDAQQNNAEITTKVMDSIKSNGIEKEKIQTAGYYLYENTEWDQSQNKYVKKGYKQTHTLKIIVEDLDKTGTIIDDAVKSGANQVERISFDLTEAKENEIRKDALSQASADAKKKADVLADSLGLKIKEISTVSESSFNYNPYVYYGRSMTMEAKAEAAPTPISPQSLEVSASVSIVYKIG